MGRRIVFVNLWPKGGMHHYSDALVNILRREDDVRYCSNGDIPNGGGSERFDITLNPLHPKNYAEVIRLMSTVIRSKPDIIHVNSGHPMLLPIYPLFSFFNSVITVHDAVPHEGEKKLKRIIHAVQLHCFALFFKKIIVHSEGIKAQLPKFVDRKKVFVMPHMSFGHLVTENAEPVRANDGRFNVLFFGRILEYKGLKYLVEAFKRLDGCAYELTIAGEGRIDCNIEAGNIAVINRFVSDEEMRSLFRACHVVALPYVSASQSGVAHLAFAFEKPVIATDVGSIGEIVHTGKNGILVPPASVDELVRAIEQIRNDETYHACVRGIREERANDDDAIFEKLHAAYDSIAR